MKKPGQSPAYRELLEGKITPEEYVKQVKKDVDRRREQERLSGERRAAAG